MSHIDPEVLALQALGENAAGADDLRHIEDCADCRAELALLTRTAAVGRSSIGEGELVAPPPRVWSRIAEELGLEAATVPDTAGQGPNLVAAPTETEPTASSVEPARPAAEPPLREPIPLRRRNWARVLAVAAAAVLLVGGAGLGWALLRPQPEVLASAALDPFPDWTGSEGTAELEENPDGSRVVTVRLDAPAAEGYREVWLITSDATALVSLGVLDGEEGTFTVPAGIDTGEYDLVDISEEPYDGDPTHSGESIVRGQLGA